MKGSLDLGCLQRPQSTLLTQHVKEQASLNLLPHTYMLYHANVMADSGHHNMLLQHLMCHFKGNNQGVKTGILVVSELTNKKYC